MLTKLRQSAHEVPPGRMTNFRPMSGTTKWWIRWTRYLQLGLRSLELVAGLGLVTLMILITNVQATLAWVMRIVVCICKQVIGTAPSTSSPIEILLLYL